MLVGKSNKFPVLWPFIITFLPPGEWSCGSGPFNYGRAWDMSAFDNTWMRKLRHLEPPDVSIRFTMRTPRWKINKRSALLWCATTWFGWLAVSIELILSTLIWCDFLESIQTDPRAIHSTWTLYNHLYRCSIETTVSFVEIFMKSLESND